MNFVRKRPHLIFLVIGLLYMFQMFIFRDYASSVIPGRHAKIYPVFAADSIITGSWIFMLSGAYLLLVSRNCKINMNLIIAHFLLTIPLLIFFVFRNEIMIFTIFNKNKVVADLTFFIPATLFIMGQVIFVIYFFRSIQNRVI